MVVSRRKPNVGLAILAAFLCTAVVSSAQSLLDEALSEEPIYAGTLQEDGILYLESDGDAWHEWAPDSLTFELLNTTCTPGVNYEFYLNGVQIGSVPADPSVSCACEGVLQSFSVTDGTLIASLWVVGESNTIRFVKTGTPDAILNALAWARVRITEHDVENVVCFFDVGGGDCTEPNLCAANFIWNPVDATVVIDAPPDSTPPPDRTSGATFVAVEQGPSTLGTASDIVDQLNDDTFFDFEAQLVRAGDIDTAEELSAFDVVVVGGSGFRDDDWTVQMVAALRAWVEDGGGVVATGWFNFSVLATSVGAADFEAIIPGGNIGSIGQSVRNEQVQILDTGHPVTAGLSSFFPGARFIEVNRLAPEAGDAVLGSVVTKPDDLSIIVKEAAGAGRSVYLGPLYMANRGTYNTDLLRSGPPDQLLEQAVAWAGAAGGNRAPEADAGVLYIAECEGATTSILLDGTASSDLDGDTLTYAWTSDCAGAVFDDATSATPTLTVDSSTTACTVTLTVSDGVESVEAGADIVIVDTTPPEITLNGEATVALECNVDAYVELAATATDVCDGDVAVMIGGDVVDPTTPGTYTVTYDAVDGGARAATQVTRTVVVQDTTSPEATASASPDALWPANHKLVDIVCTVIATDLCDAEPVVTLISISSSESDNGFGMGDGNTSNDVVVDAEGNIQLRAERAGKGDGRIYTLTYSVEDASGNSTTVTTTVEVPHDSGSHSCDNVDCDLNSI